MDRSNPKGPWPGRGGRRGPRPSGLARHISAEDLRAGGNMGGVRSRLSALQQDRAMDSVSDRFRFSCDAETTLAKVEILKIEIDPRNGRIF